MEERNKDFCPGCGCIHGDEDQLHEFVVMTVGSFMNNVFPKFWDDAKDQVKNLNDKELAEEMFRSGAINMLYGYLSLMDKLAKKEEK